MSRYPIYIPSKGRWKNHLTCDTLDSMRVSYTVVIEESEYKQYAAAIGKKRLLVLPKKYQEQYDTCDDLGLTKSVGPGAARNFIWEHSLQRNAKWHWVIDDNIRHFYKLNRNQKVIVYGDSIFRCMESFCLRYTNIAMAGPSYAFCVPRKYKRPPFTLNTRIYSCNLIRNDVPFRWRGRYNEDTILSLDMLKAHWCTVQFNAFLQGKVATQTMKGGNTKEFYEKEGTLLKSQLLARVHSDVAKVVWKFHRMHHHVDYRPFQKTRLIRKPGVRIPKKTNEFGMRLVDNLQ